MNDKPPASASNKVIISCAITGSIHVPSLTPYLPITPSQIAENAIGAAEAGAAIVHMHARDPEDGRPTPDPEVFAQFLPKIFAASDVVINITTGGGHGMSLEERTAAVRRFQPELCSLNMGSMNFGLFPILDRIGDFQYEWEPDYLEMTRDFIFKNTFKDIESIISDLGAGGTRFEFECYDVGHLYNLAFLLEKGLVEPAAARAGTVPGRKPDEGAAGEVGESRRSALRAGADVTSTAPPAGGAEGLVAG
jgi:uncharacterized protein (DUF849 family)